MKSSNFIVGSLFIVFGIVLGLQMLTDIRVQIWPLFILIPGLAFEFSYFGSRRKKDPGLLVPGGILTVIGALFFFQTLTDWKYMTNTWPVFMLAVAVGLFQLYLFGKKEKGLLVPVAILTGLFLIFTFGSLKDVKDYFKYAGPIVIIVLGAAIMLSGRTGRGKSTEQPDEPMISKKDDDTGKGSPE